jgi:hypothetical protein
MMMMIEVAFSVADLGLGPVESFSSIDHKNL